MIFLAIAVIGLLGLFTDLIFRGDPHENGRLGAVSAEPKIVGRSPSSR